VLIILLTKSVGIASGGTALFDENVVTLWANGGVLTMLDTNICDTNNWNTLDNATFCGNVANWIASPVPIPPAIWLIAAGLLSLIGNIKRG
jgi:hypothetical protein